MSQAHTTTFIDVFMHYTTGCHITHLDAPISLLAIYLNLFFSRFSISISLWHNGQRWLLSNTQFNAAPFRYFIFRFFNVFFRFLFHFVFLIITWCDVSVCLCLDSELFSTFSCSLHSCGIFQRMNRHFDSMQCRNNVWSLSGNSFRQNHRYFPIHPCRPYKTLADKAFANPLMGISGLSHFINDLIAQSACTWCSVPKF